MLLSKLRKYNISVYCLSESPRDQAGRLPENCVVHFQNIWFVFLKAGLLGFNYFVREAELPSGSSVTGWTIRVSQIQDFIPFSILKVIFFQHWRRWCSTITSSSVKMNTSLVICPDNYPIHFPNSSSLSWRIFAGYKRHQLQKIEVQ